MKEIYNSQHIYTLIETSFCPDIEKVSEILRLQLRAKGNRCLSTLIKILCFQNIVQGY
jgi:hypothetical protein